MLERCAVCESPKHRPENDYSYQGLPAHIRDGMKGYIEQHWPMGDFGMAVLRNDLCQAMGRADPINRPLLFAIVGWLWLEAPSNCWGSREAVDAWLGAVKGGPDSGHVSPSPYASMDLS